MNFRDELARVIASDPRFSIDAYAFIVQALDHARQQKLKAQKRAPVTEGEPKRRSTAPRASRARPSGHVTGAELCAAVRKLALRQFGLLAATVLNHWGLHSTSDIGEVVYNLIAAGDLEKTPADARADFDNVFDFDSTLGPRSDVAGDEAT
jgi:uncharacterized repeat protein (TIGR04138 family)